MPIKNLGSLGRIRVGRVAGNTQYFWPKDIIVEVIITKDVIRKPGEDL